MLLRSLKQRLHQTVSIAKTECFADRGWMAQTAVMASVRFCLSLVFICAGLGCAAAQSQAPKPAPAVSPDVVKMLNAQVGWDDALPGEHNPAGLHMQFAKIDSEAFLQGKAVGHFVRYRVLVPGAPQEPSYALAVWKIGGQIQVAYNQVYVNAKGLLMLHRPRPEQQDKDAVDPADEIDLSLQTAAGEPVRYALTSSESSLIVPGTVVPNPIEKKDGDCRLEARLAMPNAEGVVIYADGLEPGTDVPFQAVSEGEAHPGSFHTNAHGHAATVNLPYVKGKSAGVLKVSVAAKGCSVSIEIPWGKESYKPL